MENASIQAIISTDNPCDLSGLNVKLSREEAMKRYDKIAEEMESEPEATRLTKNFAIEELNIRKIKKVFRLLNRHFYNGTLLTRIKKRGIKIFWEYFPFNDDTFQPCLKMVAIHKNGSNLGELHFQINKNRFHKSAEYRITNGVKTRYKLEALCVSGLHEMTHAMIYAFCPKEQGHGDVFLGINHKVHGSDSAIFEYRDDVPQAD